MYGNNAYGTTAYGDKGEQGIFSKLLSETISVAENISKSIFRSIFDSIIVSEMIVKLKVMLKVLVDSIIVIEMIEKLKIMIRVLVDSIIASDSIRKKFKKILAYVMTITENYVNIATIRDKMFLGRIFGSASNNSRIGYNKNNKPKIRGWGDNDGNKPNIL